MLNHSPLPWSVLNQNSNLVIYDADKNCVATISAKQFRASIEKKENADFIVRACNSHQDLLEALDDCLSLYNDDKNEFAPLEILAAYMRAEKAIAKAKGE